MLLSPVFLTRAFLTAPDARWPIDRLSILGLAANAKRGLVQICNVSAQHVLEYKSHPYSDSCIWHAGERKDACPQRLTTLKSALP